MFSAQSAVSSSSPAAPVMRIPAPWLIQLLDYFIQPPPIQSTPRTNAYQSRANPTTHDTTVDVDRLRRDESLQTTSSIPVQRLSALQQHEESKSTAFVRPMLNYVSTSNRDTEVDISSSLSDEGDELQSDYRTVWNLWRLRCLVAFILVSLSTLLVFFAVRLITTLTIQLFVVVLTLVGVHVAIFSYLRFGLFPKNHSSSHLHSGEGGSDKNMHVWASKQIVRNDVRVPQLLRGRMDEWRRMELEQEWGDDGDEVPYEELYMRCNTLLLSREIIPHISALHSHSHYPERVAPSLPAQNYFIPSAISPATIAGTSTGGMATGSATNTGRLRDEENKSNENIQVTSSPHHHPASSPSPSPFPSSNSLIDVRLCTYACVKESTITRMGSAGVLYFFLLGSAMGWLTGGFGVSTYYLLPLLSIAISVLSLSLKSSLIIGIFIILQMIVIGILNGYTPDIFPLQFLVSKSEMYSELPALETCCIAFFLINTYYSRYLTRALLRSKRALKKKGEAAEQLHGERRELLLKIAQEMRMPINAILGGISLSIDSIQTSMLESGRSISPVQKEEEHKGKILANDNRATTETATIPYLQMAHTSASYLIYLLNDLVDLSKLASNSLNLQRFPFDLLSTVENAVMSFSIPAARKRIGLKVYFCPSLLMLSQRQIRLLGDPFRLTQIITNILSNAVKNTMNGAILIVARMERVQQRENSNNLRGEEKKENLEGMGNENEEEQEENQLLREFYGSNPDASHSTDLYNYDSFLRYSPINPLNQKRAENVLRINENLLKLTVSVADSGAGIEKERLPQVFSVYQRQKMQNRTPRTIGSAMNHPFSLPKQANEESNNNFHSSSSSAASSSPSGGLGLTICSEVVRLFNGTMAVSSLQNHGSVFQFSVLLSEEKNPRNGNSQQISARTTQMNQQPSTASSNDRRGTASPTNSSSFLPYEIVLLALRDRISRACARNNVVSWVKSVSEEKNSMRVDVLDAHDKNNAEKAVQLIGLKAMNRMNGIRILLLEDLDDSSHVSLMGGGLQYFLSSSHSILFPYSLEVLYCVPPGTRIPSVPHSERNANQNQFIQSIGTLPTPLTFHALVNRIEARANQLRVDAFQSSFPQNSSSQNPILSLANPSMNPSSSARMPVEERTSEELPPVIPPRPANFPSVRRPDYH